MWKDNRPHPVRQTRLNLSLSLSQSPKTTTPTTMEKPLPFHFSQLHLPQHSTFYEIKIFLPFSWNSSIFCLMKQREISLICPGASQGMDLLRFNEAGSLWHVWAEQSTINCLSACMPRPHFRILFTNEPRNLTNLWLINLNTCLVACLSSEKERVTNWVLL